MNRLIIALLGTLLFFIHSENGLKAQKKDSIPTTKDFLKSTSISGQYFMAYNYNDDEQLHNFLLKRGYFTLKTKITDDFSVRYTQDITLDEEGDDAGNVEMRLKYLYLKGKLDKIAFLKNSYFEIGLVHTPWLDFEQHINHYRVQGKMFIESGKIIGSADFGVTVAGLLGGKIDKKYQKEVNKKEAGKYGSYAIGIFNGGGYHATEENNNKTFQSRLTLRPLPNSIPGIQLSHGFAYGKPNLNDSIDIPDFMMNLFMLSSESKLHKFTAQYHIGTGDYSGKYVNDEKDKSFDNEGYSFFGELLIPNSRFALFSRYDNFKVYKSATQTKETFIAGLAYRFLKNKLLIDYQRTNASGKTINSYEFAIEIGF